ncbi:MAG: DUF1232 domain-containing protein [Firmicutes bacterium]|nr:DUF1232 domain-containing protein [Bacillota bacterium]
MNRIKAISSMMKDKTVPKRKKLLVVFGVVYLLLPVDLIPPVLFPFGFLDDLVLWLWIISHLAETLDQYWNGEKTVDYSKNFSADNLVEGVTFEVDNSNSNTNDEE